MTAYLVQGNSSVVNIGTNSKPMSDAHIHAFVDGQLKQDREQRLQRLIADRPEKYEQVQEYQVINDRLELGLNFIISEPLPLTFRSLGFVAPAPQIDKAKKNNNKPRKQRKPSQAKPSKSDAVREKPEKQNDRKINSTLAIIKNIENIRKNTNITADSIDGTKNIDLLKSRSDEIILKESKEQDNTGPASPAPPLNIDIDRDISSAFSSSFNNSDKLKWLVLTFVGVVAGWLIHFSFGSAGNDGLNYLTQYVVDAHRLYATENRHAVEVSALDKTHLDRWMAKHLKAEIEPANLSNFDYTLMGGRILPLQQAVTGMYMYKNEKDSSRLSIFISSYSNGIDNSIPKCDKIKSGSKSKLSVCGWKKGKFIYYVVASKIPGDVNIIARYIKKVDQKTG